MKKGLLYVYTGNGKGKTTAAVGQSVRAKSRGLRVLFAQFMKKNKGGEMELLKDLSIKVVRYSNVLSPIFNPKADSQMQRLEALSAILQLSRLFSGYDLAVLDEFTHLINHSLISKQEAMSLISGRPIGLDLIITGRGAPRWLVALADQVTDMKDVKHHSNSGVKAKAGIEY